VHTRSGCISGWGEGLFCLAEKEALSSIELLSKYTQTKWSPPWSTSADAQHRI
jgi:hypothetical protein